MPALQKLTSRQHPIVKRFRRLAARRSGETAILLDGEHLIAEAIASGLRLDTVLIDGRRTALARRAQEAGATIYETTAAVIAAASPVQSSSGIVAIAAWSPQPCADGLSAPAGAPPLALGLVDVQDPGNVGSAVRAAHALGATGVLALDRTADPAGWKALRGAMGSTFHFPVARCSLRDAVAEAKRRGLAIAAAVASEGSPIHEANLRQPLLVLLGNEGAGLPDDTVAGAAMRITIPMREGVDSLNVAATAALILYEARRQREDAG